MLWLFWFAVAYLAKAARSDRYGILSGDKTVANNGIFR